MDGVGLNNLRLFFWLSSNMCIGVDVGGMKIEIVVLFDDGNC